MNSTIIDFDDLDLSPEDQLDRIARSLSHDRISTERRCISTRKNYQGQIRRMVAFIENELPLDYEEYFPSSTKRPKSGLYLKLLEMCRSLYTIGHLSFSRIWDFSKDFWKIKPPGD